MKTKTGDRLAWGVVAEAVGEVVGENSRAHLAALRAARKPNKKTVRAAWVVLDGLAEIQTEAIRMIVQDNTEEVLRAVHGQQHR